MFFNENELKQFDDAKSAAAFVAAQVVAACNRAVAERGSFHWVLAGGSTPELCYRLLQDEDLPWQNIHCWFGDERALPAGHPDRNETMARSALLDAVDIPPENIHAVHFDHGTDATAASYAIEMAQVSCFDLVLLGMGEDGHTASLFPNNAALTNQQAAVPVFNSPKPPPERVSMSFDALNNHVQCLILATGASKNPVLHQISEGADLPVTHISNAVWVVDQSAWN